MQGVPQRLGELRVGGFLNAVAPLRQHGLLLSGCVYGGLGFEVYRRFHVGFEAGSVAKPVFTHPRSRSVLFAKVATSSTHDVLETRENHESR